MSHEKRELPYTPWQDVTRADPFGRGNRPEVARIDQLLVAGGSIDAARRRDRDRPDLDDAAKLFGNDFFGPDVIEDAFDVSVENMNIPDIPFSRDELERAKQLGMFLALRIPQVNGLDLSIDRMVHTPNNAILHPDNETYENWLTRQAFYTSETPRPGWALVGRDLRDGSRDTPHLKQEKQVGTYLESVFYEGNTPSVYKDALEEFGGIEGHLLKLIYKEIKIKDAAEIIEKLAINQLTRRYASEVIYDTILYRYQYPLEEPPFIGCVDSTLSRSQLGYDFVTIRSGREMNIDTWGMRFETIFRESQAPDTGSVLSLQFPEGREGYK